MPSGQSVVDECDDFIFSAPPIADICEIDDGVRIDEPESADDHRRRPAPPLRAVHDSGAECESVELGLERDEDHVMIADVLRQASCRHDPRCVQDLGQHPLPPGDAHPVDLPPLGAEWREVEPGD